MTGLALAIEEGFAQKWLQLFHETVPTASQVAILWNPDARDLERRSRASCG
jgi:hypothetical protein